MGSDLATAFGTPAPTSANGISSRLVTVHLCSGDDIAKTEQLMNDPSPEQVAAYAREFVINLRNDETRQASKRATDILFRCEKVQIATLDSIRLFESAVKPLPHLTAITFNAVQFDRGLNIITFLNQFPVLKQLALSGVSYGCLTNEDQPMPRTIRNLYMNFENSEDDYPHKDDLLRWMIRHPEYVPALEEISFVGVENQMADDILLVISIVKGTVKGTTIVIREQHESADEKLFKYLRSNELHLVDYRCADGKNRIERSLKEI